MASGLFKRLHQLMDSAFGAVLGGAAYGGWAVFANWQAVGQAAWRIGGAHFAMSTALTWSGVRVMSWLFGRVSEPALGALLAGLGALAATYGLLVPVHLALGTPHLLLTLAPGMGPTLAFCVLYSLLLFNQSSTATGSGHALPSDAP